MKLVWAEIDLNAIAHNVRELKRIIRPEVRFMAVVKANAYGHGDVEVTREVLKNGADFLAVARLDEGIQLRKAGFDAPILIFGYTPPTHAKDLIEFNLIQTVYSYETAEILSRSAAALGKKITVHLKIDTGMGRLGMVVSQPGRTYANQQLITEIRAILSLRGLKTEGIFTHFVASDSSDKSFSEKQFEIFSSFLNELRLAGMDIPIKHAANSGAIIDMPETHLDMVRPGISLYGLYPSHEVDKTRIALKPAMMLKAKVVHLKKVPAGFNVSYGMTYETKRPTTIATVPIGYADGLSRLLSSQGDMLVRGCRAPIAGRVCMDMTMLDVGHIPEVGMEDEVVIFGKQGHSSIMADDIASVLNTINYEIVSAISERVPRIYLR
ncbi:alanine racemase [Desulfonema magnum]|uniref:Alanine racemase n=1 Tax=Desulfonema magnum TaxID=45655 RepID=A0A975BFF1_9BACT|nr:alanine racemase [Desulfonema magnum]QTA84381.1 Alanine racemase [Desulfonema magnum]